MKPMENPLAPVPENPVENPQPLVKEADPAGEMHTLLQRPLPQESRIRAGIGTAAGATASAAGVRIGTIVQAGEAGLLVLLPGEHEPLSAQALCPLNAEDAGRPCAVLFVDGDARRPLVVGCVVDEQHEVHHPIQQQIQAVAPSSEAIGSTAFAEKREVVVDGEVVRIEATRELELRCGESVILLQSNGRIEIRGNYVTSQATATQRLRGGSVHIN